MLKIEDYTTEQLHDLAQLDITSAYYQLQVGRPLPEDFPSRSQAEEQGYQIEKRGNFCFAWKEGSSGQLIVRYVHKKGSKESVV